MMGVSADDPLRPSVELMESAIIVSEGSSASVAQASRLPDRTKNRRQAGSLRYDVLVLFGWIGQDQGHETVHSLELIRF